MPPLETVRKARLPEVYQGAKLALEECTKKDECLEWANRAEALASYARQAGDEELRKMADRIQARAIRRCGDLLKEIESQRGKRNQYTVLREGALPKQTRAEAAHEAGMSTAQRKAAIRVSNIPDEEFEESIESDDPPTVTALAERGKRTRAKPLVDLGGISPRQYQEATMLLGLVDQFMRDARKIDVGLALSGMKEHEWKGLVKEVQECAHWLVRLAGTIEERHVYEQGA
jgi:hypothetical protein